MPCFTCNDSSTITRFTRSASFRCLLKREVISVRFPSERRLKLIGSTFSVSYPSINFFHDDRTKRAYASNKSFSGAQRLERLVAPQTNDVASKSRSFLLHFFLLSLGDSTIGLTVFVSKASNATIPLELSKSRTHYRLHILYISTNFLCYRVVSMIPISKR